MRVLGGLDRPIFRANYIYLNVWRIVCRSLDSVGKQTWSGLPC